MMPMIVPAKSEHQYLTQLRLFSDVSEIGLEAHMYKNILLAIDLNG
jgi:hypothetical protein